jgi:hypothetical protein
MPKRRAVIGPVVPRMSSTRATRKVIVKKYGDRNFVNSDQWQLAMVLVAYLRSVR